MGVLARALPRRTLTVLRAESLVNDGTALVIYALAVGITVGDEHLSLPHVGWLFVLAYGGGAVAGMVTAWLAVRVRRHLHDPLQENVAVILTPFTAFLLAEAIHASGVLAVVVSGLIMSQAGPRVGKASTRQQTEAFWSLSVYLLNGSLFVLVGLELQAAVRGLGSGALTRGLIAVGAVSAAVIGVRFVWLFTTPYLIRILDRRPQRRLRRVGPRARVVSGVTGFRGAVSLAAALAIPRTVSSGAPFPDRNVIIFVTAGVIVVTVVPQALLLPGVVRGPGCPATRLPSRSATRPRSAPPKRRWPRSRASQMISAPTPKSPAGYAASTRSTCACCAPATARPRTSGRCATTSSTPRCASPGSPANGPRWSGCATSGASTTPSCARYRPGWTSRTYACPVTNWPNSPPLTCAGERASAWSGNPARLVAVMDREQLRGAFEDPAPFTTSPLYRSLSQTVADHDPLLDLASRGRPGQYPTFLFFGAVHHLLLRGADHPLARFYPSIAGEAALPPARLARCWCRSAGSSRLNWLRRSAAGSCRPARSSGPSGSAWA